MGMSLYEIKANIDEIEELIENEEYTLEHVRDSLSSLEGVFEEKIDSILRWVKNLEAEAEGYKKESDRLAALSKESENKAKSLIKYVDNACKLMEKRKFATAHFKISYRKGSEVVEVNEDELPVEYFVPQKPKPMPKNELKQLLKEGREIPGVEIVRKPDSLIVK